MKRIDFVIFIISICIFLFIFILHGSLNHYFYEKEKKEIKEAGSVDNYLKLRGYGNDIYEKFDKNEFFSIDISEIYFFYKRNGYTIDIVKDRGCVEYHAIKED